jgi:hypothetical protein
MVTKPNQVDDSGVETMQGRISVLSSSDTIPGIVLCTAKVELVRGKDVQV